MTKFHQVSSEVSRDIVEEEEDVEVRAWLEAAGADGMQWVSMLDELRITVGGTQTTTHWYEVQMYITGEDSKI